MGNSGTTTRGNSGRSGRSDVLTPRSVSALRRATGCPGAAGRARTEDSPGVLGAREPGRAAGRPSHQARERSGRIATVSDWPSGPLVACWTIGYRAPITRDALGDHGALLADCGRPDALCACRTRSRSRPGDLDAAARSGRCRSRPLSLSDAGAVRPDHGRRARVHALAQRASGAAAGRARRRPAACLPRPGLVP